MNNIGPGAGMLFRASLLICGVDKIGRGLVAANARMLKFLVIAVYSGVRSFVVPLSGPLQIRSINSHARRRKLIGLSHPLRRLNDRVQAFVEPNISFAPKLGPHDVPPDFTTLAYD
jgi:hypothetical protein